jgi:hypothetical protein
MRMKSLVLLLVIAVLAGAIFLAFRRRTQTTVSRPREFASTQEMMEWLAGEAVDIAQQNGIAGLDYSPESIQRAEEALARMHDEFRKTKSTEGVAGLASAFGAYIGECIRRSEPETKWERDHPAMGEKSYPLHWRGGDSFPMSWAYKRITNGPEDSVWHKYILLKDRADSSTSSRSPDAGSDGAV